MLINATTSPRVVSLPSLRHIGHCRDDIDVPFHAHFEMELVMVLKGNVSTRVGKTRLKGKPGSLLVLPAKKDHDQECSGSWHTLCVLFTNYGQAIEETPRVLECAREPHIRSCMLELTSLYLSKTPIPKVICDGLLLVLLSHIGHFENKLKTSDALPPRLVAAIHYLQQHVSENLEAHRLARATGVSYSRLGALFRQHFDCAPLQYHQKLRMDLAKRLLLNPYATVGEIAQQLGFENINYFCRLFGKVQGTPPGKWRREANHAIEQGH